MPSALLKPCAYLGGCSNLVTSGLCDQHKQIARQRETAHQRGYTSRWRAWRKGWMQRLIGFGITPVCGARWPGQPPSGASKCRAPGLRTSTDLHLHHTPPLREWERKDEARVCDPLRVELLCATCHNAETSREKEMTDGGTAHV